MKKSPRYKVCPHCGSQMFRRHSRWVCANGFTCAYTERITPNTEVRGNGN